MRAFDLQKHSLQFLHMSSELCREIEEGVFDFTTFPEMREVQYNKKGRFLSEVKCIVDDRLTALTALATIVKF